MMKKGLILLLCIVVACGVFMGCGQAEVPEATPSESAPTPTPPPDATVSVEPTIEATPEAPTATAMPSEGTGEVKTKQFAEVEFEYNDGYTTTEEGAEFIQSFNNKGFIIVEEMESSSLSAQLAVVAASKGLAASLGGDIESPQVTNITDLEGLEASSITGIVYNASIDTAFNCMSMCIKNTSIEDSRIYRVYYAEPITENGVYQTNYFTEMIRTMRPL